MIALHVQPERQWQLRRQFMQLTATTRAVQGKQ
jgi:hypothetical protein